MISKIVSFPLMAAALTLAVAAHAATASKATPAPKETKAPPTMPAKDFVSFDNWRFSCTTAPGASAELCQLYQPLLHLQGKDPKDESKTLAQLLATIGVFKLAGSDTAQMVIKAPLGTILQPVVVKIPGHKDVQTPFLVCDPSGCSTISIRLDADFLAAIKTAEAAESGPESAQGMLVLALQVSRPDKASQPESVNVKFALKGFSKGHETLLAKSK
jgi:invasion protein IalB